MSKPNVDNPPYLTINSLFGQYHVNLMEWGVGRDGEEGYQLARSAQLASKHNAEVYARDWAAKENLEVR